MKKYFTSALLLGVVFSVSSASAQVVDTVADQIDCAAITHSLSLGSRDSRTGGDVTTLQTYLSQANYLDTDPTGYFGNATKKAVKVFQSANGIAPQGNVGPYTRAKIKEVSCNGDVAQQPSSPIPSTPNNPVMCTMEMVQCPDGSYSGRSGPNCQTNCPKLVTTTTSPTVEFLSAPTLKLQYDSLGKESFLEGKVIIKITAGSQPINIGYNVVNGQVAQILQFNNEQGVISANSMRFTAVGNPACVWSNTAGCLIPSGSSMTFNVTNTVKASELFAGNYSMKPAGFTYYDANTIGQIVQPQDFKGISTSNSVTIMGETSPYISNVICDSTPNINCGISGSRFGPVSNTVTIGGITKEIKSTSYSWTSSTYIGFQMTEFGITQPGTYSAQVTTKEGASNTFGFTSIGVNKSVSQNNSIVITSATIKEISPTQINVDLQGTGFKKAVAMYVNNCSSGSALSFSSNSDTITGTGYASNYFPQCATSGANANVYLKDINGVSSNIMSIYVPYFNSATSPAPTSSLTINGSHDVTLTAGQAHQKVWSSTGGTSWNSTYSFAQDKNLGSAICSHLDSGSWNGSGGNTASGFVNDIANQNNVGCTATIIYTVTNAQGVSVSDTLHVTTVPASIIPAPTISIGATPSSVTSGQSTTVSWTALNVNYCTVTTGSINDFGPGSAPVVGSQVVGPLTAPRTVTITCPGKNGTTATQTITIPVTAPAVVPTPSGGSGGGTVSKMVLGAFASNTSCVDIPHNLIRGAESDYVTTLQDFLFDKGFLNEVSTGFYGDKTVEAVKDYQASKGLPVTGMVYDFTRQAIVLDTCK
jgi:peptidoglycan hydrolase-like protein with peptidoglycan-binding domain